MSDELRFFLYPLALIGHTFFSIRMLLQWFLSEKEGKSVISPIFWYLSLAGTITLMVHGWLQQHYPFFAVQICNGLIAWRNLNLMGMAGPQISFKQTKFLLSGAFLFTFPLFGFQRLFTPNLEWLHAPSLFLGGEISLFWHLIGGIGLILSSFRFWFQWWMAEKLAKSTLCANFWWISLSGALLSAAYFIRLGDPANAIGPAIGLFPYIRNLILIKKGCINT